MTSTQVATTLFYMHVPYVVDNIGEINSFENSFDGTNNQLIGNSILVMAIFKT